MKLLSPQERADLRAHHKRERDGRVRDRLKAVLLFDKGWTYGKIAEALMIDEETARRHVQEYEEKKKLKPENGGSQSKLDTIQTEALRSHLEVKTYTKASEICSYVKETFGITYTVQGMTDWLHKNGFSYKKPKETPLKADPSRQKEFIEKYETLVNETPDNEPILFMDSVHPTMATKVSYGWIKKGKDKLIASSASRTRLNLTGALNLKEMTVISQDYETINGDSILDFFKKIEEAYPNAPNIHVILDGSGYHRKKDVIDWASHSRLKLHFLPPYSPNLNSIERVWKVMNERVRDNRVFKSPRDFKEAILTFFSHTWSRIAHTLVTRINDNFNILQPASSC